MLTGQPYRIIREGSYKIENSICEKKDNLKQCRIPSSIRLNVESKPKVYIKV